MSALLIELDGGQNNYPAVLPERSVVTLNPDRSFHRNIPLDLLPRLPDDALRDLRGTTARTSELQVQQGDSNGLRVILD